jgi:hypothetical protein
MSITKTRNRLVSFRLTDEELENLRVACLIQGARNVSDFARTAVLDLAETGGDRESKLLGRFSAVELQVAEIESSVQRNEDMLRAVLKTLVNRPSGDTRSDARDDKEKERAKGA